MIPSLPRSVSFALLVIAVAVSGCGSKHPATAKVSGTVFYKGSPVAGAGITFLPGVGRPATGMTDAQGRFELMTNEPGDGALPGEHKVAVTKMTPGPSKEPYAPMLNLLPSKYASPATSPLTETVQAGQANHFEFNLTD